MRPCRRKIGRDAVSTTDVAIIGAGPYGLSLGAHLRHRGVDHRIFGHPMQFWRQIAQGANNRYLKSFGCGTNIYTPEPSYSFVEYCRKRGVESFEPCAISDFANYGVWVQENAIPNVQRADVVDVSPVQGGGYRMTLTSGERFFSKQVVIAVGVASYAHLPPELAHLPKHLLNHTSEVGKFDTLRGREVCVVGAGQSALETTMLLNQAGARPHLLVRGNQVAWNKRIPERRTLWRRLRSPISGVGTGPKAWLLTTFPGAIHHAPEKWRVEFVNRHLGAEGAWWLRDLVEDKVPRDLNCTVIAAREKGDRVALLVQDPVHGKRELEFDHVIAGTGFKVDIDRLSFLSDELRSPMRRIGRAPKLDHNFESSVPGIFFLGPTSALSFGPLFRFVAGASYAAPSLATHLAKKRSVSGSARTSVAWSEQGSNG